MGYASRYSRRMWADLWTCHGWTRLRVLWTFLRQPRAIKCLRGSFWGWLTRRDEASVEQARLEAIAARIGSRAELERVLLAVPNLQQRALLRQRLGPMVRGR